MIFVFLLMMFGLWTVTRTLDFFVRERFLSRELQTFVIAAIFCAQFGLSKYISKTYLAMWITCLIPFLIAKLCFKVLTYLREKSFKDKFCLLLDETIIEMRTGQSFRASLARANEKMEPFVQQKMQKVIEMIRFSTLPQDTPGPFIELIRVEFKKVDENSHNSLQRLLCLRHRLRTESDYRRRSGQAVLQIRAQAGILIVLYFATALFVFFNIANRSFGVEFLLSFLMFFIGTAIVFLYGRTYQWKV